MGSFGNPRVASALLASVALATTCTVASCGSDSGESSTSDAGILEGASMEAARDAPSGRCEPGTFDWAIAGVGGETAGALGIAMTPDGSTWLAGSVRGTATWGTTEIGVKGRQSAYLVKLDPAGKVLFAKAFDASVGALFSSVRLDLDGSVVAIGALNGEAKIGPTTLSGGPRGSQLVVKFDATGEVVWVRQASPSDNTFLYDVAITRDGDIVVAGQYLGTDASFEGSALPATTDGASAAVVAAYRRDGTVAWVRSWGATYDLRAVRVAPLAEGVAIVGGILGQTDFDGHVIGTTQLGANGAFVMRLDGSGRATWAAEVAPKEVEMQVGFASVATDLAGNIYTLGMLEGTVSFQSAGQRVDAGTGLTLTESSGFAIAKYDPSGVVQWVKTAGSAGAMTTGMDIATDGTEIFAVGSSHGPGMRKFDALELTSTGVLFVAQYGADGSARKVFGIGGDNGPSDGDARGIAVRPGRGISVAGTAQRTWQFGTLPVIKTESMQFFTPVAAHACN